MEITDCPMCQSPLPAEASGTAANCSQCGADLSRWMQKETPPPISPVSSNIPAASAEAMGEFSIQRGVLGALAGAILGAAAMYGFFKLTDFRFPLLGVGIGALTGYGAKLLYKGTDHTLGIVSGALAMVAVVGTLFLIYHDFPPLNIISVVVSISVAYRIAAR